MKVRVSRIKHGDRKSPGNSDGDRKSLGDSVRDMETRALEESVQKELEKAGLAGAGMVYGKKSFEILQR